MEKTEYIKPKMKYNPIGKYEPDLPKRKSSKESLKVKLNIKWWMILLGILVILIIIFLISKS